MRKRVSMDSGFIKVILEAVTDILKDKVKTKTFKLPDPPCDISRDDIIVIRNKLRVSQEVFAYLLNVSPKTVKSWENDHSKPKGAALRLLNMTKKNQIYYSNIDTKKYVRNGNKDACCTIY